MMAEALTKHLVRLADAYVAERGVTMKTLGVYAAHEALFFERIADGSTSFSARKYDEIVAWFAYHWPPGLSWPKGPPRLGKRPTRKAAFATLAKRADKLGTRKQRSDADVGTSAA